MGYNVLVITEDFTKDEHVIKPIIERVLSDVGKPNAEVLVCRNPNFGGIGEALKIERLRNDVIARYPMVNLFILFIDRDGDANRENTIAKLESTLTAELQAKNIRFVVELAHQEIEVFVLAGHELPAEWSWKEIRADPSVKDTYFREFVESQGAEILPFDGRKKLMAQAIKNWARIKSRCPEDIGSLLQKLSPEE